MKALIFIILLLPTVANSSEPFSGSAFGIALGKPMPEGVPARFTNTTLSRHYACYVVAPNKPAIVRQIVPSDWQTKKNNCTGPKDVNGAGIHVEMSRYSRTVISVTYREAFRNDRQYIDTAKKEYVRGDDLGDEMFAPGRIIKALAGRHGNEGYRGTSTGFNISSTLSHYLCLDENGVGKAGPDRRYSDCSYIIDGRSGFYRDKRDYRPGIGMAELTYRLGSAHPLLSSLKEERDNSDADGF